jgi:hypothetical protein
MDDLYVELVNANRRSIEKISCCHSVVQGFSYSTQLFLADCYSTHDASMQFPGRSGDVRQKYYIADAGWRALARSVRQTFVHLTRRKINLS